MKLRRYNHFINESVEITNELVKILLDRGKFWQEILDLDRSLFNITSCYSDMCKRISSNPEDDFKNIQAYLDKKGFNLEKIRELFSKENDIKCGYNLGEFYKGESLQGGSLSSSFLREPLKSIIEASKNKKLSDLNIVLSNEELDIIVDPFSFGANLDNQGAIQDIYFYKLFEKLGLNPNFIRLGGDGWGDIQTTGENLDDEYSESFIRYKYGYHQTAYGKLWMNQCQIDENWLRNEAMNDLQKFINEEFSSICKKIAYNIFDKFTPKMNPEFYQSLRITLQSFKLEDFSIIEDDRIIININELCSKILNTKENTKVKSNDIELAAAEFTKQMEGFALDIELTDSDDLIIWGRFRED